LIGAVLYSLSVTFENCFHYELGKYYFK